MGDHHNQHDQMGNQNHDDCQDCRRQHAQNQKLIQIYEKLQEVDKKKTDVKSSLTSHKNSFDKSSHVLGSFDSKVQRIRSNKNQQEQSIFQQIGFDLCARIYQQNKKSQSQKQNQRLKAVLNNLYQSRGQKISQADMRCKQSPQKPSVVLPQIVIGRAQSIEWFNQRDKPCRGETIKCQSPSYESSMGKSFQISTKSSFNMPTRKAFQKRDFEELNLWLFEQKNQILEKQLYEEKLQEFNNGQKQYLHNSLKGIQIERGPDFVRKTSRKQNGSTLASSFRKAVSLRKGQNFASSLNKTQLKDLQNQKNRLHLSDPAQIYSNSGSFKSKKPRRGGVLPAILSK